MMHRDKGIIACKSQANLTVINQVINSQVLMLTRLLFTRRTRLEIGREYQCQKYSMLAQQFWLAIAELEKVMTDIGKVAAGGFGCKLYSDLAPIHKTFELYDSNELISWLVNVEIELVAYNGS